MKIIFAYNDQKQLVKLDDAQQDVEYICIACSNPLVVRASKNGKRYFAHKGKSSCDRDTAVKKIAISLLQKTITEWKAGQGEAPILHRRCRTCPTKIEQPIPDKVESAYIDPNNLFHLLLIAKNKPIATIMIHESDDWPQVEIPFITLEIEAIYTNPYIWPPKHDGFKSFTCKDCHQRLENLQQETARIAKNLGISLPTSYYRYAPYQCWKCKKEMVIYTWPGKESQTGVMPTHQPRPSTIQHRFSNTVGEKYWANCCPHCHVIQGDFHLYSEPDSPLFNLDCGPDNPKAFRYDLMKIAYHSIEYSKLF